MITEKDIQTRISEILTDAGFNVVASEVEEGFNKPAVFVSVFPADAKLLSCGGAGEEVTDSIEIKYISALETVETRPTGLKSCFCISRLILRTGISQLRRWSLILKRLRCMSILILHLFRRWTELRSMRT